MFTIFSGCDSLFCKDKQPELVHMPFTQEFDKMHPFDYQEADFSIRNFCNIKSEEDQKQLLKKVDSVVVKYVQKVPRDKYKYVVFQFFEDFVESDFLSYHMYDHPISQRYPEAFIFQAVVNFKDRRNDNKLTYILSNKKLKYMEKEIGINGVYFRKLPKGLF